MPPHRLDPLLKPRSIAVLGASARVPSVGNMMVKQVLRGGYEGAFYPVNPRSDLVEGVRCWPDLESLPEPVEHAVFALADERTEAEFARAIRHGIRAATMISTLNPQADGNPPLKERIRAMAREAGVILCGGNGMGFYNFPYKLWVCGFETRTTHRAGGVVLLTHSGSLFTALVDSEERIDYALAVSSGQELTTTLADYMDFALVQPETRVIGLFMETARDPAGFAAALARATAARVPVVALKVGRTETSARLAVSHSGALAGDDAAYRALFERYGVAQVASIDELATALIVLNAARDIGPGGLATSHDSGGERGLIVDLAHDVGTRFARLSPETVARLEAALDHGLPPVNPLDRWGSGRNHPADFFDSFKALMADPDTAIGALVLDRSVGGRVAPENLTLAREASAAYGKPVCIVSNHQGSGTDPEAVESTRVGRPVLDGVPAFLKACRFAFDWHDFKARPAMVVETASTDTVARWRRRLDRAAPFDEIEGLMLLADFGVATAACDVAESAAEAAAVARRLGYPVALKTAEGVAHKSDVGGVSLGLRDETALTHAYAAMAARLGGRTLVARMVEGTRVEMILGLVRDADFGPVVLIGSGGIHAEILRDVVHARPPFDAAEARRLIDRLRLRPLLDAVRGRPAVDIAAFCAAAARFSVLAASLGDRLENIDVNPVLVLPEGCVAVDALVVPRINISTLPSSAP
jgi:acyl-CoA synthetase (NDP forming)